jgi:hypothetical protein
MREDFQEQEIEENFEETRISSIEKKIIIKTIIKF